MIYKTEEHEFGYKDYRVVIGENLSSPINRLFIGNGIGTSDFNFTGNYKVRTTYDNHNEYYFEVSYQKVDICEVFIPKNIFLFRFNSRVERIENKIDIIEYISENEFFFYETYREKQIMYTCNGFN